LIKSQLIYIVSYLNLEGLSPAMLPCGDGTGLNFPYAVIIEILIKSCKHESNKADKSPVNN